MYYSRFDSHPGIRFGIKQASLEVGSGGALLGVIPSLHGLSPIASAIENSRYMYMYVRTYMVSLLSMIEYPTCNHWDRNLHIMAWHGILAEYMYVQFKHGIHSYDIDIRACPLSVLLHSI